ncbi:hypothetical protein [Agathobacter sp.]|uniref:hypothetical protein n=1 Tax=Agathobacter sp. TaxID=2021311 RepID=UPI00280A9B4F|nr:hypothetical protein [Agathobacter sp.]
MSSKKGMLHYSKVRTVNSIVVIVDGDHTTPIDVLRATCYVDHTSSQKSGAVAHVTAPLLFVESKNKRHVFVKTKACATDFLENQKFSMDL